MCHFIRGEINNTLLNCKPLKTMSSPETINVKRKKSAAG